MRCSLISCNFSAFFCRFFQNADIRLSPERLTSATSPRCCLSARHHKDPEGRVCAYPRAERQRSAWSMCENIKRGAEGRACSYKPILYYMFSYRPGPPGLTKRGVSSYPALRFAAYGDKYGFGPPGLLDSNKSGSLNLVTLQSHLLRMPTLTTCPYP